jgi:hypothetical protein
VPQVTLDFALNRILISVNRKFPKCNPVPKSRTPTLVWSVKKLRAMALAFQVHRAARCCACCMCCACYTFAVHAARLLYMLHGGSKVPDHQAGAPLSSSLSGPRQTRWLLPRSGGTGPHPLSPVRQLLQSCHTWWKNQKHARNHA